MDNGSFNVPGSSDTPLPPPPASAPGVPSPPQPYATPYASPLPPAAPRKGTPKWVIPVVLVVVIGGIVAAALAVQKEETKEAKIELNDDMREGFIDGCMEGSPQATRELCGCLYDELAKRMTPAEMVDLASASEADMDSDPRLTASVEACF